MDNGMQECLLQATTERFLRTLSLNENDGVIAAVSGGADSMALLYALQAVRRVLPFRLMVAHVHHGLRDSEADRDAEFVARQCETLGIQQETLRIRLMENMLPGETVEQAGRRVRYAFFEQLRLQYGFRYIATAHTADDQLETVLLHLTRGSGLHGLCGINAQNGNIIRPILSCSREDVEQYCADQQIAFVTDSTNTDIAYSRNRIRCEVIPHLKAINPRVVDACTRMTAQLREDDSFMDDAARRLLNEAQCGEDRYERDAFLDAPPPIRRRALKQLMESKGADPAEKHVLLAEQALLGKGGAVQIPGDVTVTVDARDIALQCGVQPMETPYFEMLLEVGRTVEIVGRSYTVRCLSKSEYDAIEKVYKNVLKYTCDYDKLSSDTVVRQRKAGDAFHPVGGVGKSLKKYFNEQHVPVLERAKVPIVCDQCGIALIAGFSCDERVRLDAQTKRVLLLCPTENIKEEKSCEYA